MFNVQYTTSGGCDFKLLLIKLFTSYTQLCKTISKKYKHYSIILLTWYSGLVYYEDINKGGKDKYHVTKGFIDRTRS